MTTTRPVDNRCFDPTRPHGIRPRKRTDRSFDRGGRGRIALSIGEGADGLLFRLGEGRTECSFDGEGALLWGAASLDWRDGATADDLRRRRGCRGRGVDGLAGVRAPGPRQRRDGGTDLRRARRSRLPHELRCPASSAEPDQDARPRRHRHHQPLLRRDHPRRARGGRRARLHAPALAHPGGRPARARVDRAGAAAPSRASCSTSSRMSDQRDPDDGQAEAGHRPQPSAARGAERPHRQRPRHPPRRRAPRRARPRLDHLRRRPRGELDRRDALAGACARRPTSSTSACAGSGRATGRRCRPASARASEIAGPASRRPSSPTTTSSPSASSRACAVSASRVPGRRQRHRLRQHRSSPRSSSRS